MTTNLKGVRRLVGAVTATGLAGALSMSTAGAALVNENVSNDLTVKEGVAECIDVVVPTATATVNAKLTVKVRGVSNTTQNSTTIKTPELGTVEVCVQADADAQVLVSADVVADAGTGGATVNVDAEVAAEADVDAKVTVSGKQVV